MKLWIFNVLVAGALAYLFLGESEQTRMKSDLEWAKDQVETTIDRNGAGEARETNRVAQKPKAVLEPRSETRPAAPAENTENTLPRTTEKPVSTVAVEPLEAPQAVAEPPSGDRETARGETEPTGGARPREVVREGLPPLDDPEVARRRAVVLDVEESAPADTAENVRVTAMAAGERRDALNALAEDMELLFVDKTSR